MLLPPTSAMESIISMSAALVGSSKSSRWGFCREISQKTRRVFRPSESSLMGCRDDGGMVGCVNQVINKWGASTCEYE